jgi:hypothetical protein
MLSSFWLNAEEEVRLNLCYTLIVCHVLLLLDIGHITNGDNVPVIGMYRPTETVLITVIDGSKSEFAL